MSKIFIGKSKENDFNKIIENMNKKQKEILEKLNTKFGIFDSEKRKYNLKMLALLYASYLSTLGTIDSLDITSDDFSLIKSLFSEDENKKCDKFIPVINSFQNNLKPSKSISIEKKKDLYESNLLRLEKKKSELKNNSKNIKKDENIKTNTCIFCMESFEENGTDNPQLDCKKFVHGKCFIEYISSELNSNHFPIRCPLCINDNRHEINFKIILDCLLLNDKNDLALKLENRSLNHYALNNTDEVTFCPTPGCSYICFFDKDEFHLKCPLCKKEYCLKCQTEWHQYSTCQEYQAEKKEKENDVKFDEYIKGSNFKQCPNCKRWIEKTTGCNHMVCLCGNNFCYGCGKNVCTCFDQFEEDEESFYTNNSYNNNNLVFGNNQTNSYDSYNNNSYNGNNAFNYNRDRNIYGNISNVNNNNNNQFNLFGNNNNSLSNNNTNFVLFGQNNNNSLFNQNNNKNSLFGQNNNNNNNLFGQNNNNNNLFGQNNNNNNNNNLFGQNNNNNNNNLFGQNNNNNNKGWK